MDIKNSKEILDDYTGCFDVCLKRGCEQCSYIMAMEEYAQQRVNNQVIALNKWLDENHTSFKIPDIILQDYIKYGG